MKGEVDQFVMGHVPLATAVVGRKLFVGDVAVADIARIWASAAAKSFSRLRHLALRFWNQTCCKIISIA